MLCTFIEENGTSEDRQSLLDNIVHVEDPHALFNGMQHFKILFISLSYLFIIIRYASITL